MTAGIKPKRAPYASGMVWPDTGTNTPLGVRDVFGGRPFSAHIPTIGYDYDFHRGVDVPLNLGDPYYCPINGHVIRVHRTHWEFTTNEYQSYWATDNDGFGGSFTHANPGLTVTGTRGGSNSFPNVLKYVCNQPVSMAAGQWEMRVKLADDTAIEGAFGFGMFDSFGSQYIALEWDGVDLRALGVSASGNMTSHNLTSTWTAGHVWLRVRSNGANTQWATSSDASTWTTVWTETNPTWTNGEINSFKAVLYYRSTDTNASPDVVTLEYVGWYDDNTIGRFGNWVTVAGDGYKVVTLHLDDVYVNTGDILKAGEALGTVGLTGFDDRSGTIVSPHVHIEYLPNTLSTYSSDDAINPLADGILPRANVSNNVSVAVTSAQDPDGLDSHRMVVTVTRADQDFDINEFSLTGNSATRTVNWNTRSGLNSDSDIPKQSGVYFVASSFNENSATYVITIYFNHATVGATLVSAYVKDCNGVTLWSSS